MDKSVFILHPNTDTYNALMDVASQFNIRCADEVIDSYFGDDWRLSSEKWITDMSPKIVYPSTSPLNNCIISTMRNDLDGGSNLTSPGSSSSSPEPIALKDPLDSSIAIIGMSCRMPGANIPQEFWNNLINGVDSICEYPKDRPISRPALALGMDVDGEIEFPLVQAGYLKCRIDEFDAKFFEISPREAVFVDPQQRLLLEVCWESLENAAINPKSLRGSDTGVFIGIWQQDYDRILPAHNGMKANEFHHRYLGNAFSATASRLSYFLGLNGPNLPLEAGCSSSLGGIHLACMSLRTGESNLAIAGGVNLVLLATIPICDENIILSKEFRCKSFDEEANGFVRAEGVGLVVLKRYLDARRNGDNVLALIRGSAFNNDGAGTSFGTPNGIAQAKVIRDALERANVDPSEVSFVEAQGTGTPVGDPTEMWAIGQAYACERSEPLVVGSVKTNIGHTEASAGIAGLIKVILCFENNAIPPHLHLKTINSRIDLPSIPAVIPTKVMTWNGPNRLAGVNSIGMSGTNVHMLVQEPPKTPHSLPSETSTQAQIITLSGKSKEALEQLRVKYIRYLEETPDVCLQNIAFTTNTGRTHMNHRIAIIAKTTEQLLKALRDKNYFSGKVSTDNETKKVGFLFTGQGAHYSGMAQSLYNESPIFQKALDKCEKPFETILGKSLKDVLWNENNYMDQALYNQSACFCVQCALINFWKVLGVSSDTVLGHSTREFGAAIAAGILSFEDGLILVAGRSRLVSTLQNGSMLALTASEPKVSDLIREFNSVRTEEWVDLAGDNSLEEVVVSGQGHLSLLEHLRHFVKTKVLEHKRFHPHMLIILER